MNFVPYYLSEISYKIYVCYLMALKYFCFIFDSFVMASRQNSQTHVFFANGGELELRKNVILKIPCGAFTEKTLVSCKSDLIRCKN